MFTPIRYTAAATAAAAALFAAPALAGSKDAPAPDPVVSTPAPAPLASPDWTGFYAGGQIGYGNADTNLAGSDDGVIGGITGGYDYDFGQWVVGGALDYDFADLSLGVANANLEEVFRVKARGGYKLGQGLLYATAGYANADTDTLGSDDGYFVGGGYEHRVTDRFSLGGEVLYHEFDDFDNTGADVEATTVQLRGTFRF